MAFKIKKVLFLFACVFFAFFFTACHQTIDNPNILEIKRTFYATDLRGKTPTRYKLNAECLTQGRHCILYVEEGENITIEQGTAIVYQFDELIYPRITAAFGEPVLQSDEKRITLLLLDIQDTYKGSGGYVAGYFYPNDILHSSDSNMLPMLYIDTNPGFKNPDNSYTTTAHELQHLISYSMRMSKGFPQFETWIDEGLSTGAEYLYKQQQQYNRIQYFSGYESSVWEGNNFYIWGNRNDALAEYSSTYMFFQWLGIQSSNSYDIYKDVIQSEHGNFMAVTEAAQHRIKGITSYEDSSQEVWKKLLGYWYSANAVCESNEYLGYKNNINISQIYSPTTQKVSLAPGEGVFSAPSFLTMETTGLSHAVISRVNQEAYFDINEDEYKALESEGLVYAILTYNANADSGSGEIDFEIPDYLPRSNIPNFVGNNQAAAMQNIKPQTYPVDVKTLLPNNKW
ncbi:MAG: hypothetical protein LBC53_02650 [Spirochaetaceae bacterium]|jgi:hypothetical protein|nr:hypothetical protein [Spirochaetaceae bacterium]